MDINTVRGLATLFALIAFVLMLLWVYSGKRKHSYDEAAELPFADDPDYTKQDQSSQNRGVKE